MVLPFEELPYWFQTNPKIAKRLLRLIEEIRRDPFGGSGKRNPGSGKRDPFGDSGKEAQ
jgi:Txe/YoeB family toxin of Txe-Axe toxin-antitoxin module